MLLQIRQKQGSGICVILQGERNAPLARAELIEVQCAFEFPISAPPTVRPDPPPCRFECRPLPDVRRHPCTTSSTSTGTCTSTPTPSGRRGVPDPATCCRPRSCSVTSSEFPPLIGLAALEGFVTKGKASDREGRPDGGEQQVSVLATRWPSMGQPLIDVENRLAAVNVAL